MDHQYKNPFLHFFRKKIKISLEDLENDDSCSDGEWEEKEFNKGKNKKLSRLDRKSAFNLSETESKARVLPRRAVTLNKKSIVDNADIDSEVESDNNI